MPFSQTKLDQIRAGIDRRLSSGKLNDWERKFLIDMRAKLHLNGRRTTLSEKQYRKLMQLTDGGDTAPHASGPWQQRSDNLRVVSGGTPLPPQKPRSSYRRRPTYRRSRTVSRATNQVKYMAVVGFALLVISILGSANGPSTNPPGGAISSSDAGYSKTLRGSSIEIIDGDTVRVPGESRRVRLVGFNTPEVFSPSCTRERKLGEQATQRLRQLLRGAQAVEFERVACACKPGTEGTRDCNYGRICGYLRADGVDVGQTLISEGLAARYRCGRTSCPPPPGNWCG